MLTDEELKALVERLDHHNCECVVLDAAASAIRQLMREREWQPIETAPKNGTWVLVTGGKTDIHFDSSAATPPCVVARYEVGGGREWGGSDDIWRFCSYDSGYYGEWRDPTHWMPLPKPLEEIGHD